MATFTEALAARMIEDAGVAAIAGSSVYWLDVPQGTPLPYLRLAVISETAPGTLKGRSVAGWARVQVDAYADGYETARALAEAAIAAVAQPAVFENVWFGSGQARRPRDLGDLTGGRSEAMGRRFVHRAGSDLFVEFVEG